MYTSPGSKWFMNTSYLERSPPLVSAGILVFVEYLSGPSLYVEWTNWSNIFGSYSDMYTSPATRQFMNTSYLERVTTSCKGWTWCYCIEPVSEYLSGPSLYVEWTNWSKILASCSDMYTSLVIDSL